ncbi:MAG TPA: bifunctional GNAT family N-acetyltransferase/carbon-nitrogen hydrolase family protein [Anaerolineae bacterium]
MVRRTAIKVRRWRPEDIPAIVACHKAAYPDYPEEGGHYDERSYELQLAAFPEGQYLAEVDGRVVGYATALIVQLDDDIHVYRYPEITGAGTFSTHTPSGDTLYGADIAIHPDYRGLGIAGRLYDQRKKLLKRYNLRRMVAYGRLPGYSNMAGKMTADEYVEKVERGELTDRALAVHLRAGYRVKRVLLDRVWDDASLNYSTLLEMPNPEYRPEKRKIAAAPLQRPVRRIRVCAAQYLMRPLRAWEELEQTVEFFATTADEYHCHFLLLPEYFTAQLFSTMPAEWDPHQAINELARLTGRYVEMFKHLAMKHRLYIIGGSHPVCRDGHLYNVGHLFTPSGHVYTQDKLHVTPSERETWNIRPGEGIKIFETPLARIAIQVCYDIEFPEIARLLTLAGVEAIFVPFSTDEKKAFYRIKYTAQARAVENYIYVVISANVGNLPTRTYLINYGQSAIFTPSDFAFPLHATAGEAEPNVETVVIADLDLSTLAQQRQLGSVRPLYDRRPDLYELRAKQDIEIIRAE